LPFKCNLQRYTGAKKMLVRTRSLGAGALPGIARGSGGAGGSGDFGADGGAREEIRTAKKKAKKMRKRLKKLVHATNTMGASVSAKVGRLSC
jgi:hypothetical protein